MGSLAKAINTIVRGHFCINKLKLSSAYTVRHCYCHHFKKVNTRLYDSLRNLCSFPSTSSMEICRIRPRCESFTCFETFARHYSALPPDDRSTALILLEDLKNLKASPKPALTLALGGLIPLILPPLYFIVMQTMLDSLVHIQILYGAVILSFLGGIQWNPTLLGSSPSNTSLSLGKKSLPIIIACAGPLLPMATGSLICLIGGHSYVLYSQLGQSLYPSWFRALSFIFSLATIITLWTTFICHFAIKTTSNENRSTLRDL